MRSAQIQLGLRLAVATMLALSCSRNSQLSGDSQLVPGSTEALQPRISSASDVREGGLVLGLTVPQRSYVTVVRLFTQVSAAVMAPSPTATSTAIEPLEPGTHKLALAMAPMYANVNAQRTGRVMNRADGALVATDSPYPVHEYALVVTTARPLTLADQQESLTDLDLRGPDDAVIQRVAEAIGAHSAGAWAATAARASAAMAPF